MESKSLFSELLDIYTNPSSYFINDWRVADGGDGAIITLSDWRVTEKRSNDYIEFTIREAEQSTIITIPMTLSALEHARQRALSIERSDTMLYGEYEVRSVTFGSRRSPSQLIIADVVVQRGIVGEPLIRYIEVLQPDDIEALYGALREMERELIASNGYFKRLSMADVVVVDDELIYPIHLSALRFAYGREGYPSSGAGCEALRNDIFEISGVEERSSQEGAAPTSGSRYPRRIRGFIEGYIWSGDIHEDRIAVRSDVGMGFVDGRYDVVIPLIYSAVEPFREGRAVVECDRGVGLIDLWGREVIPAIYEQLEYNPDTGISAVLQDERWSYISYNGEFMPN